MYIIKERNGIKTGQVGPWTKNNTFAHFFSTRHGGMSRGIYSTLNLGFGSEDNETHVLANRQKLADAIDIPLSRFVFLYQVHGNTVALISGADKGKGAFSKQGEIPNTDAAITREKNICLVVKAADCVPLLFVDPVAGVIGAAHAGWRGTLKQIAVHTVNKMVTELGAHFPDIQVAIGPSIGPCCYEVGDEVIQQVNQLFPKNASWIMDKNGKHHFDQWKANADMLEDAGILPSNIEITGQCTFCQHEMYYSYRHTKGDTGRCIAGIMRI